MKKLLFSLVAAGLVSTGCVVVPVDVGPETQSGGFCPPGQAKKGNCRPNDDRGFCPPGQAKKGNC